MIFGTPKDQMIFGTPKDLWFGPLPNNSHLANIQHVGSPRAWGGSACKMFSHIHVRFLIQDSRFMEALPQKSPDILESC